MDVRAAKSNIDELKYGTLWEQKFPVRLKRKKAERKRRLRLGVPYFVCSYSSIRQVGCEIGICEAICLTQISVCIKRAGLASRSTRVDAVCIRETC